ALPILLGKQHINTFTLSLKLTILIPLLYLLASKYGGQGAASSFFIVSIVEFITVFFIIHKILKIRIFDFISAFCRPLLSSSIMLSVIFYIYNIVGADFVAQHGILGLVFLISLGFISFLFSILILCVFSWKNDCIEILMLKKFCNNFSRVK
ncbi:polysaccharide biosynthesis C-terminal domain-containing protein, partial [Methylobacter sp.]|uniref:polysaccharide biosynthesis C-terminal domain-containing protein n=1 Tax=Methylobacter sp. TaxID=2051955 RepID=UPI00120BBE38